MTRYVYLQTYLLTYIMSQRSWKTALLWHYSDYSIGASELRYFGSFGPQFWTDSGTPRTLNTLYLPIQKTLIRSFEKIAKITWCGKQLPRYTKFERNPVYRVKRSKNLMRAVLFRTWNNLGIEESTLFFAGSCRLTEVRLWSEDGGPKRWSGVTWRDVGGRVPCWSSFSGSRYQQWWSSRSGCAGETGV